MGKPVVHWEFWSDDPGKVADFYSTVFDWSPRPIPGLDYTLVETGGTGGINGGIMTPKKGKWPAKLALYIDVEDLDTYTAKIAEAGGKVLVARQEVPGVGHLALFEDPDGRVLGLWQRSQ